jgi:hypothetical protein
MLPLTSQSRTNSRFLALFHPINRWVDSRNGVATLLCSTAVIYLLAYLGHPALPGNSIYLKGWWGWWDQSQYLKCAAGLAHGNLTPDTYWYPIGYSFVGALFYWFAPNHPFFLPDLVLILGVTFLFYRLARRLVGPLEAFLVIAGFVICYRGTLLNTLVVPWNTTPTMFLGSSILYLTAFHRSQPKQIYLASGCLALLYFFRTIEFICFAPAIALAVVSLPSRRQIFRVGFTAASIIAVSCGTALLLNHAIFGAWRTTYEITSASIGLGSYPFLWKLYLLFSSGGPVFREAEPMLFSHFPWLLLAVPGLVHLVQRFKIEALGFLASIVICFGLYLNYNDLWPTNLYKTFLIHYLIWTLPFLALITYVGLKEAWRTPLGRWSFLSVPILVSLLLFVSLEEKGLGQLVPNGESSMIIPATPARRVDWLLLHDFSDGVKLLQSERELPGFSGYEIAPRSDGKGVLVSRHARTQPLEIVLPRPQSIRQIEFGQLHWRFHIKPRWLLHEVSRRFVSFHAALLPRNISIDITGPTGQPDGAPDQVIEVSLPGWIKREIIDWRIDLNDNRGTWVSQRNTDGWWLIKPYPAQSRSTNTEPIRLCFPDNGEMANASEITLKGFDSRGQMIVENSVSRQ